MTAINYPEYFMRNFCRSDRAVIEAALAGVPPTRDGQAVRIAVSHGRGAYAYASETEIRHDYADTTIGWIMPHTSVEEVEKMLAKAADLAHERSEDAWGE